MWHFLNNLFEPKTNGPEAATLITTLLNIKVSASTLEKEIEEHPDYPSLLSISDVLNSYKVDNIAVRIDADKLDQLPVPFITQIRGKKSTVKLFSVVKEVTEKSVNLFNPESHRWEVISKQQFIEKFLNVVLLVEADDNAGEKDYAIKLRAEKTKHLSQYLMLFCMPLIVSIAGVIAFTRIGISALPPFVFSLITLAGCVVSALLLWYEVDQHNPGLQQICSAGKKVNCDAVLKSKAAKIAGVSWSAIGFTYFAGMLLLLLFGGMTNSLALFTASWLNLFTLPYIAFSVYYQWRIAKQWCALCLSVQGLLVLQFVSATVGGWYSILPFNAISPSWILQGIIAFVLPFIATIIVLPAMQKAKESKKTNNELQKLKHNRQIFTALLEKQLKITISPAGLGINLGNPEAPYKLIKVCNPYCGPCAKAHKPMEDLLENNSDLHLQIIFTAANDGGDFKAPPVKHLLAIAEKNEEAVVKQALDDWYLPDKKDYEVFAGKYPMNGELQRQNTKIGAMKDWCDKTGIESTPTFFVSMPDISNEGIPQFYKLPKIYSVTDLKYFFTV